MKHAIFLVSALLVSTVIASGQSALATVQSLPGVGPSGEDPYPPGTEWTYNPRSGSLCSTTPDGQTNCVNVGEGRPCDEVRSMAGEPFTCNT